MKKIIYLLLIMVLFVSSCGDDDGGIMEDPVVERLVSAEMIFTRPAGEIKTFLELSGLDLPIDKVVYDVEIWKLEYETMYDDVPVVASGMVYLPVLDDDEQATFSYLSFEHGTIAANDEAPTQLPLTDIQGILYAGMASTGLVTAVPDFIGFGSSVEIMHPYYVEEPIALGVIDNLRAVRELVNQEAIPTDSELYIGGYSQGGYVAMAAHKYIEEQGLEYFDLKASFPSSGGYDIKGVRDFMLGQEVYPIPFFLAYVEEAYRTFYGYSNDFSSLFFDSPYDEIVIDIFDGVADGSEINSQLNDTISVLINPEFLADPDGGQFTEISGLFDENSLDEWVPERKIIMYHGDADVTVPYNTSVTTYDNFINSGASDVTFIPLEGATHFTGYVPYLEDFLNRVVEMEE